jgi:hypothetical protein
MNVPTETVELPSKGYFYPPDNPLATGQVEMKYMTAFHEDILTNSNYIKQGIVLDKLLQSLIVSKINLEDMLVGDKNAILVAARILGYGKHYSFQYNGEETTVDLSILEPKAVDFTKFVKGKNEFEYTLPNSGKSITFKLLTHGDELKINSELEGLKKINKHSSADLSTRLKYIIQSVEGNREVKTIREFVDNHLLALDSRKLREYIKEIQPNVDLVFKYTNESGLEEKVDIPIGTSFFWPDL